MPLIKLTQKNSNGTTCPVYINPNDVSRLQNRGEVTVVDIRGQQYSSWVEGNSEDVYKALYPAVEITVKRDVTVDQSVAKRIADQMSAAATPERTGHGDFLSPDVKQAAMDAGAVDESDFCEGCGVFLSDHNQGVVTRNCNKCSDELQERANREPELPLTAEEPETATLTCTECEGPVPLGTLGYNQQLCADCYCKS